ncbi:MAG TPA: carbohydrate ABC transporter permease [Propionicimonas sp.]|nr:carbohydrate ABC transporter permease [Propionicimonas sp.]
MKPSLPARILANAVGVVVILAAGFPVYWMVNTSFLPTRAIRASEPTWVPFGGSLDNYVRLVQAGDFTQALWVSLQVAVATVAIALVFAFLAALAVARFRFLGRKFFIVVILLIQMIPAEGLFISQYKLLEGIHLLNTVAGLTLVYVATVLPFTIWTLRGFVAGIPAELEESALVDGAGSVRAFFAITLPLLAPGLVATGVFGFIQAWNEFTLALVVMNSEAMHTLPVWLHSFTNTNRGTDWGAVMAGSTLMALPVIIFFMIVQGRMASGMVSGAVKG